MCLRINLKTVFLQGLFLTKSSYEIIFIIKEVTETKILYSFA